MKIVTSDEMREIERRCEEEAGVSTHQLMENAGLAVAEEIRRWHGGVTGVNVLVLVGPGNNGGDGLVLARHLHDWGANVTIYLYKTRREPDPNLKLVHVRGLEPINGERDQGVKELRGALEKAEIVVDAILGTGRARPLEGKLKEILAALDEKRRASGRLRLVALDLPTGVDCDTGGGDPACVKPDLTITLGFPKVGFYSFPTAEMLGQVIVADIGIPLHLADSVKLELITVEWAAGELPPRPLDAHKGTFGRALIIAGSTRYIGAAYLACEAAARVGAGLVTLGCAKSLQAILASKLTEPTYLPLPEASEGVLSADAADAVKAELSDFKALLVGCGLSQEVGAQQMVWKLLLDDRLDLPMVIDADALNALAQQPGWWDKVQTPAVLTPHPGEMARLWDSSTSEIQANRIKIAREAAQKWGHVVVLKGAYTAVANPKGQVRLSPFVNPGLASGGTGDVLAGAIVGFLAQGLSTWDAASLGVYLHGLAGQIVTEELGDAGLLASDLLPQLPRAIKQLKGSR